MTKAVIEGALRGYVDRGVLTGFSAVGREGFRFVWLNGAPMHLEWSDATRTIVFKDLLLNIAARSAIDSDLRAFLKGRAHPDLPAHRRVDPADFELRLRNRNSAVSIGLRLVGGSGDDAVHKLLLVTHEVFQMMNHRWSDYMRAEFEVCLE